MNKNHGKYTVLFLFFTFSALTNVFAQQRDAVLRASSDFSAAFVRGDAKAMAEFYTADAVVMAPARDVIVGMEGIRQYWEQVPKTLTGHRTVPDSLVIIGNEVHDYGYIFLTRQGEPAGTEHTNAKYYVIWKLEGGRWKMKLDMWNTRDAKATK